jgi:hypothetical protein
VCRNTFFSCKRVVTEFYLVCKVVCNSDFPVTNELQLRTKFFLVASGLQLSFLVASVVLYILQVGAIEIFKLKMGCNCNLLGTRRL